MTVEKLTIVILLIVIAWDLLGVSYIQDIIKHNSTDTEFVLDMMSHIVLLAFLEPAMIIHAWVIEIIIIIKGR